MEQPAWEWVKGLALYTFAPVLGWLYAGNQRTHAKIEAIASKVVDLESNTKERICHIESNVAVITAIVDNIREDIKDIKQGVKELLTAQRLK